MNTKKYNVLGMSCEGCQKKISSALNNVEGIKADVNLAGNFVEITSEQEIDLEKINSELKNAGNYVLEDPEKPKNTQFIPPQDRVSPSSVYYCPMECEGDKVYFVQGKRCPVCNMYCVPIEEKQSAFGNQPSAESRKPSAESGYYCPMFCEGDKTYPENVGCPVCGMDLVKITGNDDESEDDTYKNLQKKFWISVAFTLPVFILSMGGMFFKFPFSSRISGILQLIFTLPVVFFTGWFLFKRAWISFKSWNLNMFSLIGLGASAAFVYSIFALTF
ncbi:MAG: heavy metal-binding domain-containing protein, partial [Cloacibacterium sp.]